VIVRCLSKQPGERCQRGEVRAALEMLRGSAGAPAAQKSCTMMRRPRGGTYNEAFHPFAWTVGGRSPADVPWYARLKYIEACTCNLFCPCYFNKQAAHKHTGAAMCNFNMGTVVEKGKYGDVDLTGMKFWLAGDLGADWGKGDALWLVVTFEPTATKEQKDGLTTILTKIYPVKWKSFETDTSEITLTTSPDGKTAHAKLANGKSEIKLTRFAGANPARGSQINNVRYFAATWNSPFDLYFSDHYYKGFGKSYEIQKANGFLITVEMTSDGKRIPSGAKKSD